MGHFRRMCRTSRRRSRNFLRRKSENKHGVAVAAETIAPGKSVGVEFLEPRDTVGRAGSEEGADKAEEGGAGKVEVGEEEVGAGEGARGIDEEGGFGEPGFV